MRETTTDGEGEENVRRRGGREGGRFGQVPDIAGLDDLALDDDALDDALSDAVGEVEDRFLFPDAHLVRFVFVVFFVPPCPHPPRWRDSREPDRRGSGATGGGGSQGKMRGWGKREAC